MFIPLKLKIIFLITSIMTITAATIIYFTDKDISGAMLDQQNMLSKNVLYLIDLNIKGNYNNSVSDKINSIAQYKNILKSRTGLALNMIKQQIQYIDKKELSASNAKNIIKSLVKNSDSNKLGDLFIADANLKIIAHTRSDKLNLGDDISNFVDMKHKTVAEILSLSSSDTDPIINVYNWIEPDKYTSKQLTCFRKYKRWNWVIGSIINIDDIEVEAEQKVNKIVEELKKTFAEIKIAKTGFAFLFDRNSNLLAITDDNLTERFIQATNSYTGNSLLQDMTMSIKNSDGSLLYKSNIIQNEDMISYVHFFKPLGWYVGVTVPISEIKLPAKNIVSKLSSIIVIILLCSIVLTAWLVSRISKPLNILSEHVKEFSNVDFTQDNEEHSSIEHLSLDNNDEVGRLAESFIFMKKTLRENIKELIRTTAINECIEGELNIAKEIQLGILPKIFPPFPNQKTLDIYASIEPAKEIGGDLYDFYFIGKDKFCFAIGDVSDKGVPAALLMVITKTLIKAAASKKISPADIMIEVNNAIANDNPRTMFVTLIVGILDTKTGRITYSNGGHNPPILITNKGATKYIKKISGPVVGAIREIDYKNLTIDLNPGDALFMYTDGVTESMNTEGKFYSDKKLLSEITKIASKSSEEIIKGIKSDLKTFVGEASQYDDIAMLMIKYKGQE